MALKNILPACLVLSVLILDAGEALAAPRGCFTNAELSAEGIVRYGLRLREGARLCSEPPYAFEMMPLWESVDKQVGVRFASSKAKREGAFLREFGKDAHHRLEMWNARIVFRFRYHPVSEPFCRSVEQTMKDIQTRGWSVFAKQAALSRDEVRMDFRPCP